MAPPQTVKKTAEPVAEFRKRGQQEAVSYLNGAIYGDFGIGKTYLTGTIDREVQKLNTTAASKQTAALRAKTQYPVRFATLFANAEQGENGLPEDCADIIIKDIQTYADFGRLYDFLKLHCRFRASGDVDSLLKLQAGYFKAGIEITEELWIFDAVIIDSLSEIQKYCLYQLIGLDQDSKIDEEPEYMQQRQWGTALEMILLMVRNFRALPMHKLFIIQQMEDQDEKKKLFFRPALQGQAKSSILGFFDFVGYYAMQVNTDTTIRKLFLTPIGPFRAKHRFEKFSEHSLTNPTMNDVLAARDGVYVKVAPAPTAKK